MEQDARGTVSRRQQKLTAMEWDIGTYFIKRAVRVTHRLCPIRARQFRNEILQVLIELNHARVLARAAQILEMLNDPARQARHLMADRDKRKDARRRRRFVDPWGMRSRSARHGVQVYVGGWQRVAVEFLDRLRSTEQDTGRLVHVL